MTTRASRPTRLRSGYEPTNREAYAAHVERLRSEDDSGRTWLAALGAFDLLRFRYADRDGRVPASDTYLAGELGLSRNTWARYADLLERAGLLERVARFTNGEGDQDAGWRIPAHDDLAGREPAQTLSRPGQETPAQSSSDHPRQDCAVAQSPAQSPAQNLREHEPTTRDDPLRKQREQREESARAGKSLDALASWLEQQTTDDDEPLHPAAREHALQREADLLARGTPERHNPRAYVLRVARAEHCSYVERDRSRSERRARDRAARECDLCDASGFMVDSSGGPLIDAEGRVVKCSHDRTLEGAVDLVKRTFDAEVVEAGGRR